MASASSRAPSSLVFVARGAPALAIAAADAAVAESAAPAFQRNDRRSTLAMGFMLRTSGLTRPVELADIELPGVACLRANGRQAQAILAAVIADPAVVHGSRVDDENA